ncbi:peptidoglycan recognition protein 3-like [Chironomus tepperi]|uniref:peptidoglycan recognition protein 3-like n=1 Tax=Chironomus tepperi TaxID=113505 RepID=UPI00391F90D6
MSVSSTVDSSEASNYLKDQYLDLTRRIEKPKNILPEIIPKIRIEESEGIHVGNVIYNIHHHSPKSELDESPRTSISSTKFEDPTKLNKCMTPKSYWILSIVITIILIAIAVSVSVYFVLLNDKQPNTDSTDPGSTTTTSNPEDTTSTTGNDFEALISTREQWGAIEMDTANMSVMSLPIKRIIIAHTRGASCATENHCTSTIRSIQTQDPSLDDIPYNYLIGGDGRIYEGRGMEFQGQHTQNLDATEYNSIGICIAFIGHYESKSPSSTQISLLTRFIDYYKDKGLIADDYIIVLQDDLKYFSTKATALNAEIAKLDKFRPLYKIYRREEWNAQRRKNSPSIFETRPMNWVVIGHTVSALCSNLEVCKASGRNLQNTSFAKPWSDILYNVFFGGDGYAFEGRGFDYWGSHHSGLNDKSIGVGVIGTFDNVAPKQAILDAMQQVFDDAVALGKLSKDYKIFGRSDFGGPGPGTAFMNVIKGWCHYGNKTGTC